ncbi:hypothetical protein OH77DRAFT_1584520 [Trametes cingulata]|nr:hypothetical protein OH77DRAFT_1584520 [Trametes cingulata]
MDYFSKFLRSGTQPAPKAEVDHAQEFHKSWVLVKNTLLHPDERQLTRGIKSTDVPAHLQSMVDALVWESTRAEEGTTGACLEYLLKNDVLGTLVKLSESDRPFGIQAEVLRAVQNMVVLLDEQFLVHSAVHKAVLRLLRNCAGDDLQEQLDGRNKPMGAAGNASRTQPSEYEEDLVNLLCILCSRIRTYRELLMIFFHDKQWYRPEPLFAVEEEDEDEDEDVESTKPEEQTTGSALPDAIVPRPTSPSPSQQTDNSGLASSATKKPEYEFLLFNYLLRFVHREGQIGDFARAGLLFLMDVAMSPVEHKSNEDELRSSTSTLSAPDNDPNTDAALALAEYILDGDFSDVLAAGLAAVYSLLPTKLELKPPVPADPTPGAAMILGSSTTELPPEEKEKLEMERERSRAMGLEESSSPDFKARLDHFLKLLEFLQDVFRRNVPRDSGDDSLDPSSLVGSAIVQSILDAVRRVFLENILYPSILECSDADGSAVAVMSYIEVMIRTLENGQLADMLIDFLMSEDSTEDLSHSRNRPYSMLTLGSGKLPPSAKAQAEANRKAKRERRKSTAMTLLEMEAPEARRKSSYFTSVGRFTLKDLLLTSLRSKSQPTATAALQLFQSLLLQYDTLCVDRLLVVIRDPQATSFPQPPLLPETIEDIPTPPPEDDSDDDEAFVYPGTEDTKKASNTRPKLPAAVFSQPDTTYWTHEREMGLYLTLVSRVDPNHNEDAFSTGYDHYLRDALLSIQSQPSFRLDVDPETRAKMKHRLNPNDPILSLVLESLRKFFSNTPEMNMALTGVLATLALCADRSLAGWLTFAPKESPTPARARELEEDALGYEDDGDDRSIDFRIEEKLASESHILPASSMDEQSRPVVHTIFHGLVSQLERYRQMVDNFDQYLMERRQGLLFNENLTDALTLALDFEGGLVPKSAGASLVQSPANESPPRPKPQPKSASSSIMSFLTPKKNKPTKPPPSEPTTPSRGGSRTVDASPFGPHYQKTGAITVEPYLAPAPSSGPWTPAKSRKWNADEEDVFGSSGQWGEGRAASESTLDDSDEEEETSKVTHVTLSQLLDNVVILEESIKELVAIIHARRSLGIDSIRYL